MHKSQSAYPTEGLKVVRETYTQPGLFDQDIQREVVLDRTIPSEVYEAHAAYADYLRSLNQTNGRYGFLLQEKNPNALGHYQDQRTVTSIADSIRANKAEEIRNRRRLLEVALGATALRGRDMPEYEVERLITSAGHELRQRYGTGHYASERRPVINWLDGEVERRQTLWLDHGTVEPVDQGLLRDVLRRGGAHTRKDATSREQRSRSSKTA